MPKPAMQYPNPRSTRQTSLQRTSPHEIHASPAPPRGSAAQRHDGAGGGSADHPVTAVGADWSIRPLTGMARMAQLPDMAGICGRDVGDSSERHFHQAE